MHSKTAYMKVVARFPLRQNESCLPGSGAWLLLCHQWKEELFAKGKASGLLHQVTHTWMNLLQASLTGKSILEVFYFTAVLTYQPLSTVLFDECTFGRANGRSAKPAPMQGSPAWHMALEEETGSPIWSQHALAGLSLIFFTITYLCNEDSCIHDGLNVP